MRTSEFYFYHGEREVPEPGAVLPTVAHCMRKPLPPRPHDRLTSSVRNHSWWVSTQLRPQVQGQPRGQTMYSQPSEVRHEMHHPELFMTGQLSTMSATSRLAPHLTSRPPWTLAPSRREMYSSNWGSVQRICTRCGVFTQEHHGSADRTAVWADGQYAVPQCAAASMARARGHHAQDWAAATARQLHTTLTTSRLD